MSGELILIILIVAVVIIIALVLGRGNIRLRMPGAELSGENPTQAMTIKATGKSTVRRNRNESDGSSMDIEASDGSTIEDNINRKA